MAHSQFGDPDPHTAYVPCQSYSFTELEVRRPHLTNIDVHNSYEDQTTNDVNVSARVYEGTESNSENLSNNLKNFSGPILLNRLETILHKYGEGKAIYRHARLNNGLSEHIRKQLVRIIIQSEIDTACSQLSVKGNDKLQEFSISSSTLITYVDQILELFPGEVRETYYIPFSSNNGVRGLACGRLWDRYNYMKGCMRENGLLERKADKRVKAAAEKVTRSDDINDKLEWLTNHSEPLEKVLDIWRETFAVRQNILLIEKIYIFDYFNKILSLRLQEGINLVPDLIYHFRYNLNALYFDKCQIQWDFDQLHPNKSCELLQRWPVLKEHLVRRLQEAKGIRSADDKATVKLLPNLSSDEQAAAIFFLLPYLIPADRVGRKRKCKTDHNTSVQKTVQEDFTNRKTTVCERRESFTIIVNTSVDIKPHLQKKRADLKNRGQTLQPTPVIHGTLFNIKAAYVVVDDIIYKAESYLGAVDLCFKIFFATNCEYPEQAKTLWKFIQKGFYEIEGDTDKFSPAVNALSGELRTIWAKQ